MAFKVIYGDLGKKVKTFSTSGRYMLERKTGMFSNETIVLNNELQSINILTEENKKSLLGAAGWGIAGSVLLGPLGMIAGLISGGNGKEVCFVAELEDGRRFIATADIKTFQELSSLIFSSSPTFYNSQNADQNNQRIVEVETISPTRQLSSDETPFAFCTNCGSPIKANWKFCPKCAARLSSG